MNNLIKLSLKNISGKSSTFSRMTSALHFKQTSNLMVQVPKYTFATNVTSSPGTGAAQSHLDALLSSEKLLGSLYESHDTAASSV